MPPKKNADPKPVATVPVEAPPPAAADAARTAATEPPAAADPDGPSAEKTWAPKGPLWFQTASLSEQSDGPRMRLGRDNRFQQMAIAFDEKPTEQTRERLHAAGWKWRPAEAQWTKQLEADRRARGQRDAEDLFAELTGIERRDRQVSETVGAIRH